MNVTSIAALAAVAEEESRRFRARSALPLDDEGACILPSLTSRGMPTSNALWISNRLVLWARTGLPDPLVHASPELAYEASFAKTLSDAGHLRLLE